MNARKLLLLVVGVVGIAVVCITIYKKKSFDNRPMTALAIGDQVPHFVLKDQNGNDFDISNYIGKKKLVIYFYPKDESSGCTKQACAFRDSHQEYADLGAMVIGVNSGTVASHRFFTENHQLPFTILSDPGNKVLKQFGVKNILFLTGRETFVVGLDGRIAFKFRAMMNAKKHPSEVMDFMRTAAY